MSELFLDLMLKLKFFFVEMDWPVGIWNFLALVLGMVGILGIVLVTVMYMTLFERKWVAWYQMRVGPNRVGWRGAAQPIADAVKLLFKEDIIPAVADKPVHFLAPIIVFTTTMAMLVVIPFGAGPELPTSSRTWYNPSYYLMVKDLNIGLLYVLSIASAGTVGVIMAGWGSNNKYTLLGAMRAVAQTVTYEVPLIMSVMGVVMMTGSLSMTEIVAYQADPNLGGWLWKPQLLGLFCYFACALAETNRAPFDLMEAEQEIVAGFHTEYSGMKFALFFLAEYANMFIISAIAVTCFFGGWLPPFLINGQDPLGFLGAAFASFTWFMIKCWLLIIVMYWLRTTWPRIRVDQFMGAGWKIFLPLAILNILITGWVIAGQVVLEQAKIGG